MVVGSIPKDEGSEEADRDGSPCCLRRRRRAQQERRTAAAMIPRTLQTTIATMPCVERRVIDEGSSPINTEDEEEDDDDDDDDESADRVVLAEPVTVATEFVADGTEDVSAVVSVDAVAVMPAVDCTELLEVVVT